MELLDLSSDKFYKFVYDKLRSRIPEAVVGKITVATVKALNYLKVMMMGFAFLSFAVEPEILSILVVVSRGSVMLFMQDLIDSSVKRTCTFTQEGCKDEANI
jgi:hypothetical protein